MMNEQQLDSFIGSRPKTIGAFYTKDNEIILIVKDVEKWHLENKLENKSDYRFLSRPIYSFGKNIINYKTGIVYLSSKTENGQIYGVIGYREFISLLLNWNSFIVPSVFHKKNITIKSSGTIDAMITHSRLNALKVSLLLLGQKAKCIHDLYRTINNLVHISNNIIPRENDINDQEFIDIYGKENELFSTNKSGIIDVNCYHLIKGLISLPDNLYKCIHAVDFSYYRLEELEKRVLEFFSILNPCDYKIQEIKDKISCPLKVKKL